MRKRTARRNARVFAMCIGVGAVIAAAGAIGAWNTGRRMSAPALQTAVHSQNIVLANTQPEKRVFPYSVIPGGVHSRQELTDAIARDSVVAEHYRSLSIGTVRAETIGQDRLAYVSYRIGNKIYWTKHQVRLKQGETILTDGLTQVRARCGNCISMQPMLPTSDAEPDAIQTDALVAPGTIVQAAPLQSAGPGAGTILAAELLSGSQGPLGNGTSGIVGGVGIGPSIGGGILGGGSAGSGGSGGSGNNPASLPDLAPPGIVIDVPPIIIPPGGDTPGGPGTPPDSPFTPPGTPGTPPTDPLPPLVEPPPVIDIQPQPPAESAPVPEPGTLILIGSGLATMLARRRKS